MANHADLLRSLPSVDDLIRRIRESVMPDGGSIPAAWLTASAREAIDACRARIRSGEDPIASESSDLVADALLRLHRRMKPRLPQVINGTGIIVHTGLGRSPLAAEAVLAIRVAAERYVPVELDMDSGERGRRVTAVRDLLCEITGAESAAVVNNNAAAMMLTLSAVARDRSVLVSRGELIEIGGSFRLPEVMRAGGAILREVGTTNRTRLADYASAIGPSTAAIMKVHTSNYRVEGFTAEADLAGLSALAREHHLVLIDDIGSGLLRPSSHPALRNEPDALSSLAAGADLVLFSGDKLLGGPQAGIILGRSDLVEVIEQHPMMRALRVDKLTLAGLAATLTLHVDDAMANESVPVLRMLSIECDTLRGRAERLEKLLGSLRHLSMKVSEAEAFVGGGSVPTQAIPSIALRIRDSRVSEEITARMLRQGDPPVLTRREDEAVWCDLRTVVEVEDALLAQAIRQLDEADVTSAGPVR